MESEAAREGPTNESRARTTDHFRFVGAAKLVAGVTLLSRLSGLARDAVCSRAFGAGAVWSAFAIAFLLPNLFRRLFGEGALAAAFVPEYARLTESDPRRAEALASLTVGALLTITCGLVVVMELGLWALARFTPLGESGGLAIRLTMLMLPYMPMVCATALLGGMLQTHHVFTPAAAAPIVLNTCLVVAATVYVWGLGANLETAALALAFSVLIAGLLQLAWAFTALRGRVAWTKRVAAASSAAARLLRRMGPVAIGLGALQLNVLLDGLIAAWPVLVGPRLAIPGLVDVAYPLDEASNSVLFYAQRLYHFPLGVFGLALATAIYPTLARESVEPGRFAEALSRGVRLSLFIGLPASAGLVMIGPDLSAVLFGGARFDLEAVRRVSAALLGYAPAIWAYMLVHLLTRAFYAQDRVWLPVLLSFGAMGVNIALNLTLIWFVGEIGLAWATSLASILHAGALWLVAGSLTPTTPQNHGLRGSAALSVGLSILMLVALALLSAALPSSDAAAPTLVRVIRLVALTAAGAALYMGASVALRRPESRWLLTRSTSE